MSCLASDTRRIAARMTPWDYPQTYTSADVPDWEYLRVHALRLADGFEELRDEWIPNVVREARKPLLDIINVIVDNLESRAHMACPVCGEIVDDCGHAADCKLAKYMAGES